jgi:hypothetical protein
MFITKAIPWTTLVYPFTALNSTSFCLTSNHILEHIRFTTITNRFNFPCIYFDNLSVWWCCVGKLVWVLLQWYIQHTKTHTLHWEVYEITSNCMSWEGPFLPISTIYIIKHWGCQSIYKENWTFLHVKTTQVQ